MKLVNKMTGEVKRGKLVAVSRDQYPLRFYQFSDGTIRISDPLNPDSVIHTFANLQMAEVGYRDSNV